MNYLNILTKLVNLKQKKQKINALKNIAFLSALGLGITSIFVVLVAQSCSKEIRNNVISEANNIDKERDEIKKVLENIGGDDLGAVGLAMENAVDDLEDDNQNKNEAPK